jgi:hypothetical protein
MLLCGLDLCSIIADISVSSDSMTLLENIRWFPHWKAIIRIAGMNRPLLLFEAPEAIEEETGRSS